MCFLHLIIGHLLGDFVLQTDKIAENKAKYPKWNILHAAIVTFCVLLFSIPFGTAVIVMVILSGILHYYIDYYKLKISSAYELPGLVYFLADQFVHILIIYIIAIFAETGNRMFLLDIRFTKMLLILLSISSFAAVLNQYILMVIFPNENKKFFEEDEKDIGNLTRISIVFGFYFTYAYSFLYLFAIAGIFALLRLQFSKKWSAWMKQERFVVKLLLDVIISLIGVSFLIKL